MFSQCLILACQKLGLDLIKSWTLRTILTAFKLQGVKSKFFSIYSNLSRLMFFFCIFFFFYLIPSPLTFLVFHYCSCLTCFSDYSLNKSVQVKLVNISNNDIVDGNPKLILGLVWSIILHWQVNKPPRINYFL